jgi:phosphoribosylglycinamide formyltransferase-1
MHTPEHSGTPLKLGIITYDHANLKTEQLIHRLLLKNQFASGRKLDLKVLALPYSVRPARSVLFSHRPDQDKSVTTRQLAARSGLDFLPCTYDSIPDVADCYVVGSAGILSGKAIGDKKIINAHPGIIPSARGLDAFKWSIFDAVPLGVTLHYIDAEVDAGDTIAILRTPVFPDDSLDMLARRHYELELDVLGEFLTFLDGKAAPSSVAYPEKPPHMRMPASVEKEMIAKFDEYKQRFSDS